MIFLINDTF